MGAMASQITSLTIANSTVYQTQIKENIKARVTGLCAGNSPVTGEFPTQRASNAKNVSIWWRHHGKKYTDNPPLTKAQYRKVSNTRRTKSQNLIASRPVLQLSLPNLLKPCIKSRMKM